MSYETIHEDENYRVEACYHVGSTRYHGPYLNRCVDCGMVWATQVISPPPHLRRIALADTAEPVAAEAGGAIPEPDRDDSHTVGHD